MEVKKPVCKDCVPLHPTACSRCKAGKEPSSQRKASRCETCETLIGPNTCQKCMSSGALALNTFTKPTPEWDYLYRYNAKLNVVVVFESYTEIYGDENKLPYNVFSSFTKAKRYGIGICKAERDRARTKWEECNSKYKNLYETTAATQSWDMETPKISRHHSTGRFIKSINKNCIIETWDDPTHIFPEPLKSGILCEDCYNPIDLNLTVYFPGKNHTVGYKRVCNACYEAKYKAISNLADWL